MEKDEISKLQGKALRHEFIRALRLDLLGSEDGPLVSVLEFSNEIYIFTETGQTPKIRILEIEQKDAKFALNRLQNAGAEFLIDQKSRLVTCNIQGVSAQGSDYLEAGMRAYIKASK